MLSCSVERLLRLTLRQNQAAILQGVPSPYLLGICFLVPVLALQLIGNTGVHLDLETTTAPTEEFVFNAMQEYVCANASIKHIFKQMEYPDSDWLVDGLLQDVGPVLEELLKALLLVRDAGL